MEPYCYKCQKMLLVMILNVQTKHITIKKKEKKKKKKSRRSEKNIETPAEKNTNQQCVDGY